MQKHPASRATVFFTNAATLLLVAGIGFGAFIVASTIDGAVRGGHGVAIHQQVDAADVASLPRSVERPQSIPVTIHINDARPNQVLVASLRDFSAVLLVVALLWILRRLLVSVRAGDPFTTANVRRLRAIGFICIVGVPLVELVMRSCDEWLASSSSVGQLGTSFSIPGAGPIVGLGVLVLAEVFAHGARLRADIEGTI